MKRLVELPAEDRLTARAHVLVRALGSTVESNERLQRVRRALDAPKSRAVPGWALRVALAVALLAVTAVAAAGPGRLWSALVSVAPAARPSAATAPTTTPSARARLLTPPPKADGAPLDDDSTPVEAIAPASPSHRAASPHLPAATSSSDVARVHEAAMALRHDGNPARALQLLEAKPVNGPLAEEALALRIEASSARKDGQASKLASAYLARFPNGRYRDLAKSTLSGRAP
ncbi:MAG TPA: hypothetical protein VHB79_35995 [Polyangiaceae bacterium]|nr:hypothetical protein [Polyangiaceae bacterium]